MDPLLVRAVIRVESNFDPKAVSPKGAAGLMQLMPETAMRYGVDNRFDPTQNVDGGVRYLRDLMAMFDGNLSLALAAYNAGEGRVDRALRRYPKSTFWQLAYKGHLPVQRREFEPRFFALVRLSELGVLCQPNGLPALQQASR